MGFFGRPRVPVQNARQVRSPYDPSAQLPFASTYGRSGGQSSSFSAQGNFTPNPSYPSQQYGMPSSSPNTAFAPQVGASTVDGLIRKVVQVRREMLDLRNNAEYAYPPDRYAPSTRAHVLQQKQQEEERLWGMLQQFHQQYRHPYQSGLSGYAVNRRRRGRRELGRS
ncbi:hypothetical protein P389DRAFT_195416 [Cystobasidium minutum MCA 4210]|uniref:uncharacterized protein n=1 Tax=Cystobasidium minutum MCA 4210 TaxID=1397322 RepID=UPI0034CE104A|eukprot:jgi/Rhomi1/195416/gm1.3630_g